LRGDRDALTGIESERRLFVLERFMQAVAARDAPSPIDNHQFAGFLTRVIGADLEVGPT
jgi:hypothetical protein